ncbi:MAG: type II secretion system protein [Opitutaceae bacterium]|nr:type II secretion system protein [Opitutaceae bacterium]
MVHRVITPPLPSFSRKGCRAFTLIELLTVIAIMGILAAIFIPVTGKVRSKAQAAQCTSNLRQVYLGVTLYANEQKGRLPGGINDRPNSTVPGKEIFRRIVPQYLASNRVDTYDVSRDKNFVLQCPGATFPGSHVDEGSYGANYNLRVAATGGTAVLNHLRQIHSPAHTLLAGDRAVINSEWLTEVGAWAVPEFRHGDTLKSVFFDGSVQTLRSADLTTNQRFLPQ